MDSGIPPDVGEPVTAVIHMAAKANFVDRCFGPIFADNLSAAVALARWAAQKDALFVFASAAGVHGRQGSVGSGSKLDPQDDYTLSKLASEVAIRAVAPRTLSLRIGGVYGIDGPAHLGLNQAITRAVREATVPMIRGGGHALRNYICVEDVARWIRHLMHSRGSSSAPLHETVYVAHTEHMTVREYIAEIAAIVCGSAPIEVPGAEVDDFTVRSDPPPFDLMSFQNYLRRLCDRE
jgi:nucleoside-diphosphate-sugar epimerase